MSSPMVSEAAEIPGNLLNVEPLQKVSGLLIVNWSYRNIPSGRGFRHTLSDSTCALQNLPWLLFLEAVILYERKPDMFAQGP